MGFEIVVPLLLVVAGVAAWVGHSVAKRAAPSQSELDELKNELEAARQTAESVQANVSDHFEQSAVLFGKLASDYREFLEHFSSSAQALGLSEARARELIERGSQPLLSHDDSADAALGEALEGTAVTTEAAAASADESASPEAAAAKQAEAGAEPASSLQAEASESGEPRIVVEMPDDAEPSIESASEATKSESDAEPGTGAGTKLSDDDSEDKRQRAGP